MSFLRGVASLPANATTAMWLLQLMIATAIKLIEPPSPLTTIGRG